MVSSEEENGDSTRSSLAVQILLLFLLVHEVLLVSMFSNCVYDDVEDDVNDKSLSLQQSILFVDGPALIVVVAAGSSQSDDGGGMIVIILFCLLSGDLPDKHCRRG
jgi:hypothetical protein